MVTDDAAKQGSRTNELLKRAADGDRFAAFELAEYYGFNRGDAEKHLVWLRRAAELGHPYAKQNLGVLLTDQEQWKEASRWLQEALRDARAANDRRLEDASEKALSVLSSRMEKAGAKP